MGSTDDWLKTLDLKVTVETLSDGNLARSAQLFNKTNQLNMATRRLLESELKAWAGGSGRKVWTFSVADRFGNSGLTGMCSVEIGQGRARIVDFLLSCRVMGRKVEQAMLHVAVGHARSNEVNEVHAQFVATERNGPCLSFWNEQSAFAVRPDGLFVWDASQAYPLPDAITLVGTP